MSQKASHKPAAKVLKPQDMTFIPRFAYGDQAQAAPVCGSDGETQLGAGYVRMTNASIPWTIKYDEMVVVIEGTLTIHANGEALVAGPGESIWLPNGTELVYESESALLFYAIHPANWAEA
jgi:ethanolamine utilization protein EutQ